MKEERGKVLSIVTVSYNSEKTIEKTLKSVLNQTFTKYEYILVDGNSTDNTNKIIQSYRCEFENKGIDFIHLVEKDDGIYDAMNKGIKLSNGRWINFMNSDDTFSDNRVLEKLFSSEFKDVDVIYGNENRVNKKSQVINKANRDIKELEKVMFMCHQSTFVKTELLKKNNFDTKYKICSDYDNLLKLYLSGKKFKYIDLTVCNYSVEGTSNMNYYNTALENYEIRKKYQLINMCELEMKARSLFFKFKHRWINK